MMQGTPAGKVTMTDDMGTFRIELELASPSRRDARGGFDAVLVDTGAELSVFPAGALEALGIKRPKQLPFRQGDGNVITRWTGPPLIYCPGTGTTDELGFRLPGGLGL